MCYTMLEIILNVNKLVQNAGSEQDYDTWGRILDKVELVLNHCEKHEPNSQCITVIHEIINKAEELIDTGQFNGDLDRIYSLVNRFIRNRPESSVIGLMTYLFNGLQANSNWLTNLNHLMGRFFSRNENVNIRIKALDLFVNTVRYYQINYEEELMREITQVLRVNLETDIRVKNYMIELLIELCTEFSSEYVKEFLVLLKEVLLYPFHVYHQTANNLQENYAAIKTAVNGFIRLFKTFLFQLPSENAIDILTVLVNYLDRHYAQPEILDTEIEIRCMILEFILQLQIDKEYRLGLLGHSNDGLSFSPFLLAVKYKMPTTTTTSQRVSRDHGATAAAAAATATTTSGGKLVIKFPSSSFDDDKLPVYLNYVSLSEACGVIVTALKKELEWKVLLMIFQHIPESLKNKALVISGERDAGQLALTLCAMISDKSLGLPGALRNTPKKFTGTEFHGYLFPILCSFVSFHAYLTPPIEQKLIKCLEVGLVSWSASQCVSALTICILEMRTTMVKLLPEVLLNLSKISATVHIAIPILEFLSTLAMFPTVFVNFIPDQYMSIFAISLPYTNPLKYNYYIVCLAHHVISIWFLRCNKILRRDFVKYIINGLKSNALSPFIEREPSSAANNKSPLINEDSSNRKRSTSLIEKDRKVGGAAKEKYTIGSCKLDICHGVLEKSSIYESLMSFHRELVETCVDLMSRYTFSTCRARPKRHDSSAFLFEEGQSMTWLLGSKLITITTSVCTQKPIRGHLCDKCSRICAFDKDNNTRDQETSSSSSSSSSSKTSSFPSLVVGGGGSVGGSGLRYRSRVREGPVIENLDLRQNVMIMMNDDDQQQQQYQDQLCSCWCQGWVEIRIRRPTGDTTWTVRLENETNNALHFEPLMDISTLNLPSTMNKGLERNNILKDQLEQEYSALSADDSLDIFSVDVNKNDTLKSTANSSGKSSKCYPANVSDAISRSAATVLMGGSGQLINNCNNNNNNNNNNNTKNTADGAYKSQSECNKNKSNNECNANCSSKKSTDSSDNNIAAESELENIANGFDSAAKSNTTVVNDDCDDDDDDVSNLHSRLVKECELKTLDLQFREKRKQYRKELRGNYCEAIPEESNNTSPSGTNNVSLASSTSTLNEIDDETTTTSNNQHKTTAGTATVVNSRNNNSSSQSSSTSVDNNNNNNNKKRWNTFKTFSRSDTRSSSHGGSGSGNILINNRLQNPLYSRTPNSNGSRVAAKPPPSATGPRIRSAFTNEDAFHIEDNFDTAYQRPRVHTVSGTNSGSNSVIDDIEYSDELFEEKEASLQNFRISGNPSFVFLQLFHSAHFGVSQEPPLLLPSTPIIRRALTVFDMIPPYETHKIGVIYVGPGQTDNEVEILRNQYGSVRYIYFIQKLGTLRRLADADPQTNFLGGLAKDGSDGNFAYIWEDDIMQVVFHVASLMPTKQNDQNCNNKKRHIGNDYVTIVYNDSGADYNLNTVKCQFNFACVIVEPLDLESNRVTVKARKDLKQYIGRIEPKIVSDENVSLLARQLALHMNLASSVFCSLSNERNGAYASNWLERLRKIKHIRNLIGKEVAAENSNPTNTGHGIYSGHAPISKITGNSHADNRNSSGRTNSGKIHPYDFTEYT